MTASTAESFDLQLSADCCSPTEDRNQILEGVGWFFNTLRRVQEKHSLKNCCHVFPESSCVPVRFILELN